jgi:hypothetical protein
VICVVLIMRGQFAVTSHFRQVDVQLTVWMPQVKLALALMLCGGVQRVDEGGTKVLANALR